MMTHFFNLLLCDNPVNDECLSYFKNYAIKIPRILNIRHCLNGFGWGDSYADKRQLS